LARHANMEMAISSTASDSLAFLRNAWSDVAQHLDGQDR
jgi:hypothetical protein